MVSNAGVWEKQLEETSSEGGASHATSWKDVTATISSITDTALPASVAAPIRFKADKIRKDHNEDTNSD